MNGLNKEPPVLEFDNNQRFSKFSNMGKPAVKRARCFFSNMRN